MAGYYRINKKNCQSHIADWLEITIKEQRWKLYDDLHIDEISKVFYPRERWYYSSLFLLKCLDNMLDKTTYNCFLAIPLMETGEKTHVDEISIDLIKKELHDMTPPSLYVFPKNDVEYNEFKEERIFLEKLSLKQRWNLFFSQRRYEDECYIRTIIVESKNDR